MPRLSEDARRHSWFIAGPTASGKSDVAMTVCERLRTAEVIAADSMTLYRGMDIGTAKPSAADRERVPHHLVDVRDPHETCSVAEFVRLAAEAADEVLGRGGTPVFVGGAGLYLRSLLRGVFDGPPADEAVRRSIQASGTRAELHARLKAVDPVAAAAIEPNDVRRTVRALEVFELTGRTITEFRRENRPDGVARRVFWLDHPRATLHERINRRADAMLAAGWPEEAAALFGRTPPLSQTARQALGYAELFAVAAGEMSADAAADRIKARTRQFAKRQCTWFRNLAEARAIRVEAADTPAAVADRLMSDSHGVG